MTFHHLKSLMDAIGFVEIRERWKKNGKMAYWLYRKAGREKKAIRSFEKKIVLREGNRNNFNILLYCRP
jgi:25S rRNA (adenine2142-N1)-methyltransferase